MAIEFTACTPAEFKIKTLYEDFYKQGMIDFNTEYQHSEVWKLLSQQVLLPKWLYKLNRTR